MACAYYILWISLAFTFCRRKSCTSRYCYNNGQVVSGCGKYFPSYGCVGGGGLACSLVRGGLEGVFHAINISVIEKF